MKRLVALLMVLQLACDAGIDVSYQVSMEPAQADSISQLSLAIASALAQRHAMEAEGTTDGCSLASYHRTVPDGWLDFCITHGVNAVRFHLEEWRTGVWSSRGDGLRYDLRDTLTAQFGARVSEER